jgi:hypothetical protein
MSALNYAKIQMDEDGEKTVAEEKDCQESRQKEGKRARALDSTSASVGARWRSLARRKFP